MLSDKMGNVSLLYIVLTVVCGLWEVNAGFYLNDVGASVYGDTPSGRHSIGDFQASFGGVSHRNNDDSPFGSFDGFSRGSNDGFAHAALGGFESPMSNNNGFLSEISGGAGGGGSGIRRPGKPRESLWSKKKKKKGNLWKKTSPPPFTTKEPQRIVLQTTKTGYFTQYPPPPEPEFPPQKAWKKNRKPQGPGDPLDD